MPISDRTMGATLIAGNMNFRVWAPNASSVAVAGTFNSWSATAHPLASEANGYWSVTVPGTLLGEQYRFVVTNPNFPEALSRMDPYARQVVHDASGNLNAVIATRDESLADVPSYRTPAWNELVIYELHVRTFLSGGGKILDQNGVETGSFTSLCTRLDYLRDLGINAIEVMPLGQFLGDISAGYNPAYIFAIEDEFGGPDAFRTFVQQAHLRGIAVIVDVVYNHIGSPAADMWQFDGWTAAPNFGGIYFYNDWRSHTRWGDRPDYGRGDVRQYLADNVSRWLEHRYADGLRWDSVGSIRNVNDADNDPANDLPDGWSLCQWLNTLIAQNQPWKISIAEDLKNNPSITRDVAADGAGFDAQWGTDFYFHLLDAVTKQNDADRNMDAVASAISQTYNNDAFQRVIFTESHDGVDGKADPPKRRIPEAIWPGNATSWKSRKLSTLAASALLTSPGIPMLFMGQEFLSWGAWQDNQVMDWTQAWQYDGITNLYRDLIRLRRNWFNTTRGLCGQHTNILKVDHDSKLIACHRWSEGGPGDDVIVILNFSSQGFANYTLGLPRPGMWRVRLHTDWNGYDAFFGNWFTYDTDANGPPLDNLGNSANIGIGPYSALILSQD